MKMEEKEAVKREIVDQLLAVGVVREASMMAAFPMLAERTARDYLAELVRAGFIQRKQIPVQNQKTVAGQLLVRHVGWFCEVTEKGLRWLHGMSLVPLDEDAEIRQTEKNWAAILVADNSAIEEEVDGEWDDREEDDDEDDEESDVEVVTPGPKRGALHYLYGAKRAIPVIVKGILYASIQRTGMVSWITVTPAQDTVPEPMRYVSRAELVQTYGEWPNASYGVWLFGKKLVCLWVFSKKNNHDVAKNVRRIESMREGNPALRQFVVVLTHENKKWLPVYQKYAGAQGYYVTLTFLSEWIRHPMLPWAVFRDDLTIIHAYIAYQLQETEGMAMKSHFDFPVPYGVVAVVWEDLGNDKAQVVRIYATLIGRRIEEWEALKEYRPSMSTTLLGVSLPLRVIAGSDESFRMAKEFYREQIQKNYLIVECYARSNVDRVNEEVWPKFLQNGGGQQRFYKRKRKAE